MTSGVYVIRNTVTGECYVGESQDLQSREYAHFIALRGGYHFIRPLQASYDQHGREAFAFEVLEFCRDRQQRRVRERSHVDALLPAFNAKKPGWVNPGKEKSARTMRLYWRRRKAYEAKMGKLYLGICGEKEIADAILAAAG